MVEGLGKRYRIGGERARYTTARESLVAAAVTPWRRARAVISGEVAATRTEEFWALRDVSFEVGRGEVLGVIGRNGSGKSTLLKLLSRVTEPSEGEAIVRGRMGALLEVGTGFHPELTGRENIFLNGSILGMRRRDIERRFDDIVAFSEIGRFMDTPVKRYSSGMYVRLAFSVAAHLEPDILVIDEVLAVGDAAFQRKCLGQMGAITEHGRTVLFVSHNMAAVRQLCTRCLWIDGGRVREWGPTDDVIAHYLRTQAEAAGEHGASTAFDDDPALDFQVREARLTSLDGTLTSQFDCDSPITVELRCAARVAIRGLYAHLEVQRTDGTTVMVSDSYDVGENPLESPALGLHEIRVHIPARSLAPGEYQVVMSFASALAGNEDHLHMPGVVGRFTLEDHSSNRGNARRGYFSTLLRWDVRSTPEVLDRTADR